MGKYNDDENVRNEIWKWQKKIAEAECGLGKDSSPREWTDCKVKQQLYMLKIKELDPEFYDTLEVDRNETEADRELKQKFNK